MVLDFGNQKNLVVVGCDLDSWGDTLGRRRKGLSINFEDAASKGGVHMESGCQIVFLSFLMIKRNKIKLFNHDYVSGYMSNSKRYGQHKL